PTSEPTPLSLHDALPISDDRFLALQQNIGAQLHRAWLVMAMHVARRRREHIPSQAIERLMHREHVLRRRIQLIVGNMTHFDTSEIGRDTSELQSRENLVC